MSTDLLILMSAALSILFLLLARFCWMKYKAALAKAMYAKYLLEWLDEHPHSMRVPPEVIERANSITDNKE